LENIWADFRQLGQDLLTLGKDLFFSGSIIKILLGVLLILIVSAPGGLVAIFIVIFVWRNFQAKRHRPPEEE
jgi:hypothetical protein